MLHFLVGAILIGIALQVLALILQAIAGVGRRLPKIVQDGIGMCFGFAMFGVIIYSIHFLFFTKW